MCAYCSHGSQSFFPAAFFASLTCLGTCTSRACEAGLPSKSSADVSSRVSFDFIHSIPRCRSNYIRYTYVEQEKEPNEGHGEGILRPLCSARDIAVQEPGEKAWACEEERENKAVDDGELRRPLSLLHSLPPAPTPSPTHNAKTGNSSLEASSFALFHAKSSGVEASVTSRAHARRACDAGERGARRILP